MFTDFYHSFYYTILVIGALTGLVFVMRVDAPFKWLSILLLATLISEVVAKFFPSEFKTTNNNPVYHVFTIIEYLIYAIIYSYFFNSIFWTRLLTISVLFLIVAESINVVFFQPFQFTPTNSMILESLLLIFLSLSLFLKLRTNIAYANIFMEGVFWFNSSVLCYYSFNILIWGFHSIKVYELKNPPTIIYNLILLLSGVLYLLYAASIVLHYLNKRNPKQSK